MTRRTKVSVGIISIIKKISYDNRIKAATTTIMTTTQPLK